MSESNLILTGFMGAGKTTVGQIIAGWLNLPFVDTDATIVAQVGQSIPAIFATYGEAEFRRLEAEICANTAAAGGQVIATGGGAIINTRTRAALENSGLLICLTADFDSLVARTISGDRPLARDRTQMAVLLSQRQAIYSSVACRVDTTGKSPDQVASEVIALWRPNS